MTPDCSLGPFLPLCVQLCCFRGCLGFRECQGSCCWLDDSSAVLWETFRLSITAQLANVMWQEQPGIVGSQCFTGSENLPSLVLSLESEVEIQAKKEKVNNGNLVSGY